MVEVRQGIPRCGVPSATPRLVTSGLTATICDAVASGLQPEVTHMARIGYGRVSTVEQDLNGQVACLTTKGCDVIRAEKASGASRGGRGVLATILAFRISPMRAALRC